MRAPEVKLGQTVANGIAPSMFALIDRGVGRRPELANELNGKVVIRFREEIAPVRITFGRRVIRIEDGDMRNPDLTVTGSLPHIVQLTVTPMGRFGIPDFRDSRGRAALLRVASGRVRLGGDLDAGAQAAGDDGRAGAGRPAPRRSARTDAATRAQSRRRRLDRRPDLGRFGEVARQRHQEPHAEPGRPLADVLPARRPTPCPRCRGGPTACRRRTPRGTSPRRSSRPRASPPRWSGRRRCPWSAPCTRGGAAVARPARRSRDAAASTCAVRASSFEISAA